MHNFLIRHGALLERCDADQRGRAMALVSECLSAAGMKLTRDVMRLNEHIGELTGRQWRVWRMVLLAQHLRHAVHRQTLGLAARRASLHRQLLHPRRSDGADADVPGLGAGLCQLWQTRRHPRAATGGSDGPRAHERTWPRPADRRADRHGASVRCLCHRLQRQSRPAAPGHRLSRSRPRAARAAPGADRRLCRARRRQPQRSFGCGRGEAA